MGMIREFKEFAVKGSVVDMAVGIIIGGAFTPIVRSLVGDVIMPPIGLALGDTDFSELKLVLREAEEDPFGAVEPEVAIAYGQFLNQVFTFLVVAWAVFLLVKGVNRMRRKEEAPAPEPTTRDCPYCLLSVPRAATRCGHCSSEIAAAGS